MNPAVESQKDQQISEWIGEYHALSQIQTHLAKQALHKHSQKQLPETHPSSEHFEHLPTLDDLADFCAFPDSVTGFHEESIGWERQYGISFESVQKELTSNLYLSELYRILYQLGYPAANKKICTVELTTTAMERHLEQSFIDTLKAVHDPEFSQKVTERYLADYFNLQSWGTQSQPIESLLNLIPILRKFHCWGCGAIHLQHSRSHYCSNCNQKLRELPRERIPF